jgi:FemAB-related protein (PEP-CTERM system-associated)
MNVIEINNNDVKLSEFLVDNKHSYFHTFAFKKFIEKAFGVEYSFVCVIGSNVEAILPIVKIKSKIFGDKIISSGYIEYGGFAGNCECYEDIICYLRDNYSNDFSYLEIRDFDLNNSDVLSGLLVKEDLYKRFVLELKSFENLDSVWKNIQKSKRKAIKKSLKFLQVRELELTDLDEFYELYFENMRRFGSPAYSKKYFESFFENIVSRGLGKIYGAFYYGKLVSSLLGFYYEDRVHIIISVSDEKHREFRANDIVHWEFIKWAVEEGFDYFDFGRVREGSGQFEYKKKWGAELLDLPSYFDLWKLDKAPVNDPNDKSYQLKVKAWKMVPSFVSKKVGMKLRKEIGI